MKITFKDVGQGDSIILEWEVNNEPFVGIIDCNKKGRSNPVLDHLIERGYNKIEFAILSHPHRDHFSGFYEVFDYCLEKEIRIKLFVHTINHIDNYYWRYFEIDTSVNKSLEKMIEKSLELHDKKLLEYGFASYGYEITLSNGVILECLSPSHSEILKCQTTIKFEPEKNKKKVSSAANLLSTVFRLRKGEDYLLLTSDAEKQVFLRFQEREMDTFDQRRLVLCQAPHHGSKRNYEQLFWEAVVRKEQPPVVTSAGMHHQYHHPDFETLQGFHQIGYVVHSTNIVNGMQTLIDEIREKAIKLDGISTVVEEYWHDGDQTFELNHLI